MLTKSNRYEKALGIAISPHLLTTQPLTNTHSHGLKMSAERGRLSELDPLI